MNYKELVLSHNPSAYCTYDLGNSFDSANVLTSTGVTTNLNPVYDSTGKAMGMRSKKLGTNGSGSYDYRKFNAANGRTSYIYAEAWVYIPTVVGFDQVTIWAAGSSTNPGVNASTLYVRNDRKVGWSTTNGSLNTTVQTTYSTAIIPFDTWVHIGAKYDNGAKTIYINGVVDNTSTVAIYGINGTYYEGTFATHTAYIDEWAMWEAQDSSGLPTNAEILQRATFPRTKTAVWDATNGFWVTSGDEQYWDGTQWISMQDLPYKVWNGTEWVAL